jgi:hypothetical protein
MGDVDQKPDWAVDIDKFNKAIAESFVTADEAAKALTEVMASLPDTFFQFWEMLADVSERLEDSED